ncbi:MAG TPA: class II aldolase/adducin family protein [Bacillota bacterium]|nr:hypothetical protein [Fastidiosipila sp.]HPX93065.1 class II aldolase/adducin family protein [Bacillota bacterium]HQB80862.1 class II aldolase/adducin family protein [Bacillota bacterium]
MEAENRAALEAVFDRLRRSSVLTARVRMAWKQADGSFLFASRDASSTERLTADELAGREPVMASLFRVRSDADAVLRSLPDYAGDTVHIRNFLSFAPALDDAASLIGTRIVLAGSDQLRRVLTAMRKRNACIIRPSKDGREPEAYVLALGKTPAQAVAVTMALERACQALIEGSLLGGVKRIKPWAAAWKRLTFLREKAIESAPSEIPPGELEKREAIARCVNQLLGENLIQAAVGAVSLRLDEQHLLMTLSGDWQHSLSPRDSLRVNLESLENDRAIKPFPDMKIHAALMKRYPRLQCIILTRAPATGVFAACRQPVPVVRPQDQELLGDGTGFAPVRIPSIMKALARSGSGTCILGNRGALAAGESEEEAMARCRSMETAARCCLDSKARELRG